MIPYIILITFRKEIKIMFSPLYMGTNHMLGIDNYVPLTVNNQV